MNFPDNHHKVDTLFGISKPIKLENMTLEELTKKNSPLTAFVLGNPFDIASIRKRTDRKAKTHKTSPNSFAISPTSPTVINCRSIMFHEHSNQRKLCRTFMKSLKKKSQKRELLTN